MRRPPPRLLGVVGLGRAAAGGRGFAGGRKRGAEEARVRGAEPNVALVWALQNIYIKGARELETTQQQQKKQQQTQHTHDEAAVSEKLQKKSKRPSPSPFS